MRALITDHRYDDYSIERSVFDKAGVELEIFEQGMDWEEKLSKADALLVDQAKITASDIDMFNGKVICRYGTGADNVDVQRAAHKGIKVALVPDYCVEEVADHALAMILACARKLNDSDAAMRKGLWNEHTRFPINRLSTCTLGIIGFGRTGKALAWRAERIFGRIIVYSGGRSIAPSTFQTVSLEELAAESDFVSLHIPMNEKNRNILDGSFFSQVKNGAYLINIARGALIEDSALIGALESGRLSGAALDVYSKEPPGPQNPYISTRGVLMTDHSAYYSRQSFIELRRRTAENAVKALFG